MNCDVCGDPTNQADGELRDLGKGLVPVCAGCIEVADRIASGNDEAADEKEEVSTKYAV